MVVPYIDLRIRDRRVREAVLTAVERVFDHGQFILGPEVENFEKEFASLCGTRFAVGVDNGTSALCLTMKGLGIGPGDEVITAPNSFLASASSIALIGAKPVFVDVGKDYNMNPALLEAAITSRTKAILPVHLTGRPADMDAILAIAERHHLPVIEDAAQAVGARYKERKVGSLGRAACFSFHPLKNLHACGDGGIVTTNDETLYHYLLLARNHGLKNRNECEFWSVNARLDALQAAILSATLPFLNEWTEARRTNAAFYREALSGLLEVPDDPAYIFNVYQTFVVRTDRRDALVAFLKERGIEAPVHYPLPIHLQKAAISLGYREGGFPAAEVQAKTILSLPVRPDLSEAERTFVVESIQEFFQ
jgi:dTDP-4-amino-4,6-dideoxygalactose transaminase